MRNFDIGERVQIERLSNMDGDTNLYIGMAGEVTGKGFPGVVYVKFDETVHVMDDSENLNEDGSYQMWVKQLIPEQD